MTLFYPLLFLLLLSCPASHADSPLPVVKATPVLMKQIKVLAIGEGQVRDSLRLPARVDLDQQHVAQIGATVTGRITETDVVLGQEVRKGELLAILNSTELGLAQSAYLKTGSQVNLRRLAVNRAKRLLASDVIAAAELQERESMLNEADVDLRTATDQLRVFGMSDSDLERLSKEKKIHSFLPITASIQGTVVERNVMVGQVVQPADALFTVADLSHVWVVAELPEQQASWVRKGDEAIVTIAALPEEELSGRLIYVADMVDPNTRTVTVRMALPNPQRIFKPHMLATLLIRKQDVQGLVLPDSAVIRVNDSDHVFVETAPEEFQLRPVQLGIRYGNVRRILGGLKLGDKVVVEGGFHLNSERQRKELE
ncbi:efflux RND transporter periplasmic adaptor subunit [Methylobacter sp.]|uniref:efflux RND transporter periplasmic adaptor subunit n=1 Tax=Methylobacter sp. TaxID=2051955 RepID=UPI002FDEE03D